jgi:hypothetical protein
MFRFLDQFKDFNVERAGRPVNFQGEQGDFIRFNTPREAFEKGVLISLDMLGQRAVQLGIILPYAQGTYLPTSVMDVNGLMAALKGIDKEQYTALYQVLSAYASRNNTTVEKLTDVQKTQALSESFLQGRHVNIKIPGTLKEQTLPHVPPGLVPYFESPEDILRTHLRELNDHLPWREAMGETPRAKAMKRMGNITKEKGKLLTQIEELKKEGKSTERLEERVAAINASMDEYLVTFEKANDALTQTIPAAILDEVDVKHHPRLFEILHSRVNQR